MKPIYRPLLAFAIVLALDVVTKNWAEETLSFQQPVPVIGEVFRFTLGYNTGVAFGMFSGGGLGLLALTGTFIIGLTIWGLSALRNGSLPLMAGWAMGLILGGAVANFIDRFPDMRVTDFLDVGIGMRRWPTFNLADSFLLVGIIFLMMITLFHSTLPSSD